MTSVTTVTTRKRKPASSRRLFATPHKRARTNPMSRPFRTTLVRQHVSIGRGPIAPSVFVNLRYVAGFRSDGTTFDHVFNLNSIFDPDRTGTGHQPLGRDQYATFYNRYRVWSVRVKVVGALDPGVDNSPVTFGIVADNSGSAYTNMDQAFEQQNAYSTIVASGANSSTVVRRFRLWDVTGVSKQAYKDDRFQALFSTDPAEQICLHVIYGSVLAGAAVSNALHYRVQLDMRCELFDPLPLAQS